MAECSPAQKIKGRGKNIDMTRGSIISALVRFALPLLIGNLFQQLYNMVDTWVIGQTGESGAYSAVGSVGPITNILVGFFIGFSSGASVVVSQYFGAKKEKDLKETVHTAAMLTIVLGVLFTIIGLTMTPILLKLMLHGTENEVYPAAYTYLMIYFSGMFFLIVYNMSSGLLRAVGDSSRPFYFLAASAVTNIILDFLFVFGLRWGVAGVAAATVIAQAVSASCCITVLLRTSLSVRISVKEIRFHADKLKLIVKVGLPASVQMALTAFSNVFVQSYIANVNSSQTAALGGWTTYGKVDQIIFLPIQSLGLAVTTFVGQNLGSGNVARAKKGPYISFFLAVCSASVLMAIIMIFAPFIAKFFTLDSDIVAHATVLLRYLTPFYFFCCVNQIFTCAMRGAGNSTAPMICMITSFIVVRQIYLYVVSNFITNEFFPIAFSYPVGWMACSISMMFYYFVFFRMDKSLIGKKINNISIDEVE